MKNENNEPDLPVPEPQELLAALRADLPVHLSFEVRNPRAYAAIVAASEAWPPIPEAYTRKLETTVYAVDTVTFTDGEGGEVDLRGCVWSTDQGFMIKAPDGPKGQGVLSVGIWDESERERLHLAAFDARNRRLKMKKPRSLGRFGAATANESHVWLTDPKATDTLELLKSNLPITLFFGFPEESFQAIGDQARDWEVGPSEAFDTVVFQQAIGEGEGARASKTYTLQGVLWGTPNGVMLVSGKSGLRLDYRQSGPPENSVSHGHLVTEIQRRNRRLKFNEPPYLGVSVDAVAKVKNPELAKLGDEHPYYTFPEMRAIMRGLAEAPLGKNWNESEGEVALIHDAPEEHLQTKLIGAPMLTWWQFQLSNEGLKEFLARLGIDAALCLQVCLHMAVENDRVTVEMDELIKGVGWNPRSTVERREMRRKVWTWLTCFANMAVIGVRPGTYKDSLTKKTLELRSKDPLIAITGTREPIQQSLDGSEAPTEVSFVAGEWLVKFKGNRQVLQDLGNARKIASIPGGKPSGAWARSYAIVLLQHWRESAAKEATVKRVGDENTLSVKLPTITRKEIHERCPQMPYIQDVLGGPNPKRALVYDQEAWQYLQEVGIVATDAKELLFEPQRRKGWADDFLNQEIQVRPGPDIAEQVAEIHQRALDARKRGR